MLPSGLIRIDGRSYDASSEGMPIEAGQRVKVVDVQTNRLVVRLVAFRWLWLVRYCRLQGASWSAWGLFKHI
jgi:hypothetical protein